MGRMSTSDLKEERMGPTDDGELEATMKNCWESSGGVEFMERRDQLINEIGGQQGAGNDIINLDNSHWQAFVDAATFQQGHITGFAMVFEDPEGGFIKAISGYQEGVKSATVAEACFGLEKEKWVIEDTWTIPFKSCRVGV
ncbi:hypothetical protein K2173_022585 [Erythroxylum novogranatense]|uniref:Uncharacterized protein n=1 Tax=Erythroxylum novogranatense TaxID=1862640 RepID=A0AAV8TRG7_9ROSI|nr:hypothetical protein K2173_022585 [Erythroxylum novogranatense]